jgi:hypothetical protein
VRRGGIKFAASRQGEAVVARRFRRHYEGGTLVIDTIGIKSRPFAMLDVYGTPFTDKLHVVERYRLVDYDEAKDDLIRLEKEHFRAGGGGDFHPNDRRKVLQLQFTDEDDGVFTMPWTARITYRRAAAKRSEVPTADKPDF